MRQWGIDTNVVVSGLLTPHGPAARVLDAVVDGRVQLVHDARILAEYREVLPRPRFRIEPGQIAAFLTALRGQLLVSPHAFAAAGAPDPDDLIFVEVARWPRASRRSSPATSRIIHPPCCGTSASSPRHRRWPNWPALNNRRGACPFCRRRASLGSGSGRGGSA